MSEIQMATRQQAEVLARYLNLPEGSYALAYTKDSITLAGSSLVPELFSKEENFCFCQAEVTLKRLESGRTAVDYPGLTCTQDTSSQECMSSSQYMAPIPFNGKAPIALTAALLVFGQEIEVKPRHQAAVEALVGELQLAGEEPAQPADAVTTAKN